jgi:hypothetical protein
MRKRVTTISSASVVEVGAHICIPWFQVGIPNISFTSLIVVGSPVFCCRCFTTVLLLFRFPLVKFPFGIAFTNSIYAAKRNLAFIYKTFNLFNQDSLPSMMHATSSDRVMALPRCYTIFHSPADLYILAGDAAVLSCPLWCARYVVCFAIHSRITLLRC